MSAEKTQRLASNARAALALQSMTRAAVNNQITQLTNQDGALVAVVLPVETYQVLAETFDKMQDVVREIQDPRSNVRVRICLNDSLVGVLVPEVQSGDR